MALTGKGMFIWKVRDVYGGDVSRIANAAKQGGFSHVLLKVADGRYAYNITNGVDLASSLVKQLHAAGIKAWGWQYVYGSNASAEADMAVRRIQSLGLDGFVVDAEGPFKASGMNKVADLYMKRLTKAISGVPVALSSYRYPKSHTQFPFTAFLNYCDLVMPQVYWEGASNPASQLGRSVTEYRSLNAQLPIVPTGAAYAYNGWTATAAQITEFLNQTRALGLPGANFWEWATAMDNGGSLWNAINGYAWATGSQTGGSGGSGTSGDTPVIDDSVPAYTGPKYIRLKHDKQWMTDPETKQPVDSRMELSDWHSGYYLSAYPAVVPLWTSPKGGDGAYKYSVGWANFLRASNPINYPGIERIAAGLFNPRSDKQDSFPKDLANYDGDTVAEGIGSTGNLYQVVEEKSGSVRVQLIDYQSQPLKPSQLNYEDTPWLMNAFTSVAKGGALGKVTGKDLVFPNLGKAGAGWVPKERVEFFPELPMIVTINASLNIRKGPGTENDIVGRFSKGESTIVYDYSPRGSNVWGKIDNNRWIALAYTSVGGTTYYTNWKMETDPPLALKDPRPYLQTVVEDDGEPANAGGGSPNPTGLTIVDKYFAALNKADAKAATALYSSDGPKLIAEDRRFSGEKAIYNWYQRMFHNKLPGAKFKLEKATKDGSFYNIKWSATGKKAKVKNGKDVIRVEDSGAGRITYHYTEFDVTK